MALMEPWRCVLPGQFRYRFKDRWWYLKVTVNTLNNLEVVAYTDSKYPAWRLLSSIATSMWALELAADEFAMDIKSGPYDEYLRMIHTILHTPGCPFVDCGKRVVINGQHLRVFKWINKEEICPGP